MASETLYAGPAKVYRGGTAFFPEGENGSVDFTIEQERLGVAAALHGQVGMQQGDATGKISFTPFDNWGSLAAVYPAVLGASTGSTTGALVIGTKLASGAALVPTTIWVPGDARSYVAVNTAITKPPDMHLGVGKSLFGPMEITCIGDPAKEMGAASFLFTVTESAAADPGGQFTMADFVRERWTGAWGSTYTGLQTEEEWTVSCEVKTQAYKLQKLTRLIKLVSVAFMVKGRLVGPTHTQINTMTGLNASRLLGDLYGSDDLVLTSTSGKTITLKHAAPVGTGFEFGGSRLGTGETAFVNKMSLTAGAADPLIIFSA